MELVCFQLLIAINSALLRSFASSPNNLIAGLRFSPFVARFNATCSVVSVRSVVNYRVSWGWLPLTGLPSVAAMLLYYLVVSGTRIPGLL